MARLRGERTPAAVVPTIEVRNRLEPRQVAVKASRHLPAKVARTGRRLEAVAATAGVVLSTCRALAAETVGERSLGRATCWSGARIECETSAWGTNAGLRALELFSSELTGRSWERPLSLLGVLDTCLGSSERF